MAISVRLPPAARRELRELGFRLRQARLRRRLPLELIAQRSGTTRQTVTRIEAGDPSVKIGTYAAVLQALGMLQGWGHVEDRLGARLEEEELPKRARQPNKRQPNG